jgi:hypothetical protein
MSGFRKKKCKVCKEWYQPKYPLQKACTAPCAIKLMRQDKAKKERKRLLERKRALKTPSKIASEVVSVVNKYICKRDRFKGCISCGGQVSEAGHYVHAGSRYRLSPIRFDLMNIHGQCGNCNRWNHGKIAEYQQGLIARYGQGTLDYLNDFKIRVDRGEVPPLGRDELLALKKEYQDKIKAIKI